jgi:hypothetical protein
MEGRLAHKIDARLVVSIEAEMAQERARYPPFATACRGLGP